MSDSVTTVDNTVKAADIAYALDVEFLQNFDNDVTALAQVIAPFGIEVLPAGTVLKQYKVSGSLATGTRAEGAEVPLSKYTETGTTVGEMTLTPYRKVVTGEAIAKHGYEHAILRTDRKMLNDVRTKIVGNFYTALGNGTGTASAKSLQPLMANMDAALDVAMESNGDSTTNKVFFINPMDRATFLGDHQITGAQNAFGMSYLEGWLGISGVAIFTSKVTQGTAYCTAAENIHLYAPDIAGFAPAGLEYEVSDSGIIGVKHTPAYNKFSAETNVICGLAIVPEVKNYIIKGTISSS